jgi:formate dehydrogenase subunit beta
VPIGADIVVAVASEERTNSKFTFLLNSKKGAELAEGMPGKFEEVDLEAKEAEQIRSSREKQRKELETELKETVSGLEEVIDTFASCTGCHGCSAVCPICYCQLCEFDSSRSDLKSQMLETELRKRKGIRIPSGTLAFHIGRLAHMAISCVGCGMCSDVCPADIPVSSIFWKVGKAVQELFDYVPGRDVEEAIPITTFAEDELGEVED